MMRRTGIAAVLLLMAAPSISGEKPSASNHPCPPGQSCSSGQDIKTAPQGQPAGQTSQAAKDELCEPARWSGASAKLKQADLSK